MTRDAWRGDGCPVDGCTREWPVETIRAQCILEHGPAELRAKACDRLGHLWESTLADPDETCLRCDTTRSKLTGRVRPTPPPPGTRRVTGL